jgi:hypothetical protein
LVLVRQRDENGEVKGNDSVGVGLRTAWNCFTELKEWSVGVGKTDENAAMLL